MYKKGDTITIMRDNTQPEYIDTDAEILFEKEKVLMLGSHGPAYYVRRWDGTQCYYKDTSVILTKARYTKDEKTPPPIPGKCQHLDTYNNVISAALSFIVCRNCKEEV